MTSVTNKLGEHFCLGIALKLERISTMKIDGLLKDQICAQFEFGFEKAVLQFEMTLFGDPTLSNSYDIPNSDPQ